MRRLSLISARISYVTLAGVLFACAEVRLHDGGAMDAGAQNDSKQDAPASDGTGHGEADFCDDYVGLVTAEEVESTPRVNETAELLALEGASGIVASQALYERVEDELQSIRAGFPAIKDIQAVSRFMPRIVVELDRAAALAGYPYTGWDCPNEFYRAAPHHLLEGQYKLDFIGLYDFVALADEYAGLPHVLNARVPQLAGDGSDICLAIDGDTSLYIFDQASQGDCYTGCAGHELHVFVAQGQDVEHVGKYDHPEMRPPPAYLAAAKACAVHLMSNFYWNWFD